MDQWCNCGACLTLEELDMGQCGCCGARFRYPPPRRRKTKATPLLDIIEQSVHQPVR